ILRGFGVQVKFGVLQEECRMLNAAFRKHARTGLPRVTLKMAQSLDGKIALRPGRGDRITNGASISTVHRMRADADAILVGAGTIASDNPQLTVRRVTGKSPRRVVVDGRFRSHPSARVFSSQSAAGTMLFASTVCVKSMPRKKREFLRRGISIYELDTPDRNG